MFSGKPYTPITGSKAPETFNGITRYEPIYDSENAYSVNFHLFIVLIFDIPEHPITLGGI